MKKVILVILTSTMILTGCGELPQAPANPPEAPDNPPDAPAAPNEGSEDSNGVPDDSGEGSDNSGGQPGGSGGRQDNYACNINSDGFCIFTGAPHQTGLSPSTNAIVDRDGNFLFYLSDAVAANASGEILTARGTPAFEGDDLIESSHAGLSDDDIAFHHVMAIMYPIRNALMYDIAELTQPEWDELVEELAVREIKETTFTQGATPKDNYYGRQGVFDLAKNPGGRDIHHDVMKFLEESGIYFLCHVTSDEFNQSLADNHPEGHDPCVDAEISTKILF